MLRLSNTIQGKLAANSAKIFSRTPIQDRLEANAVTRDEQMNMQPRTTSLKPFIAILVSRLCPKYNALQSGSSRRP